MNTPKTNKANWRKYATLIEKENHEPLHIALQLCS